MLFQARIIKIGNSQGIILPQKVIKYFEKAGGYDKITSIILQPMPDAESLKKVFAAQDKKVGGSYSGETINVIVD